jgi:hypothetical protein
VSELAHAGLSFLQAVESPEQAEQALLQLPQAECPVVHYFGPGVAIREVRMAAGTLAVGHHQKYAHLNVLVQGKVALLAEDGSLRVVEAPLIYTGQPGRKVGYVLEDVVWQNIYPTDIKDADAIEDFYIEKSDVWKAQALVEQAERQFGRAVDRQDFAVLLEEMGTTPEVVRAQTENKDDQEWVDCSIVRVADSDIEGKGLFLTAPVKAGLVICPARVAGKRTQAGRFVNHSLTPNAQMVMRENGDIDLVALVDLDGCLGGSVGQELTIDYRKTLALSGVKLVAQESVCQP